MTKLQWQITVGLSFIGGIILGLSTMPPGTGFLGWIFLPIITGISTILAVAIMIGALGVFCWLLSKVGVVLKWILIGICCICFPPLIFIIILYKPLRDYISGTVAEGVEKGIRDSKRDIQGSRENGMEEFEKAVDDRVKEIRLKENKAAKK